MLLLMKYGESDNGKKEFQVSCYWWKCLKGGMWDGCFEDIKEFTQTDDENEMDGLWWKDLQDCWDLWRHQMEEMWCHYQKYPRETQQDDCVVKWRKMNKTNLSKEGVSWRNQKKCQRGDLIPDEWREGVERARRRELKKMEIRERGKEGRIEGSEAIGKHIIKRRIMME